MIPAWAAQRKWGDLMGFPGEIAEVLHLCRYLKCGVGFPFLLLTSRPEFVAMLCSRPSHIIGCSLLLLVIAPAAVAFQDENKPDSAYDADQPERIDPLKGDPPAATRVAKDASRIAELAGEEIGGQIDPLLNLLFDGTKTDDERLDAAGKLKAITSTLDPQDRVLQSVGRQISRRVRLAEAGVSALKAGPSGGDARELTNGLLIRAAIDYENSGRDAHAQVARRNYQLLRQNHPSIYSAVRPVMMTEFFNYNLHMTISEPMLSRIVSDYRKETGGVAECILGAWVTGCQVTDTAVRADIRPSQGSALFCVQVDGRTISNTQGRKSPATIFTRGNHGFRIEKPTYFDGQTLTSGPATMNVNAHNRTVGVSTDFDRVPILGGIVRGIAAKEAAKKQRQSEAIAAGKLADRALPEFEREIGRKYSEANNHLQNTILKNLRDKNVAPESFSARSSETHIALSSRTISPGNLAAPPTPSSPAPRRGIAIQVHESTINATIDTLGLGGDMKVDDVIKRIENGLEDFLNRDVSLRDAAKAADDKTDFDFDPIDPVRVRFDEGEIIFILRTGFFQAEKQRRIPRHVMEIPLGVEVRDGGLYLIPPKTDPKGILSLRPQAIEGRSSFRSIAQARAIAKEILDKTFKEPLIEIDTNLNLVMADNSNLRLRLTKFDVTDGWITVVFQ